MQHPPSMQQFCLLQTRTAPLKHSKTYVLERSHRITAPASVFSIINYTQTATVKCTSESTTYYMNIASREDSRSRRRSNIPARRIPQVSALAQTSWYPLNHTNISFPQSTVHFYRSLIRNRPPPPANPPPFWSFSRIPTKSGHSAGDHPKWSSKVGHFYRIFILYIVLIIYFLQIILYV